jgi:XTP/dITP diphosphohydrolase
MIEIVFATNNKNKIAEVSKVLEGKVKLLSLADINCIAELPETTGTIEGNALQKAKHVAANFNVNCFADDTGLEIETLNGKPGVDSAFYAGSQKNADDNMQKVLTEMLGNSNRNAQFKTIIALVQNGNEYLFEGIIHGKILNQKQGTSGFGYDPIFMPNGYNKSFAEMSLAEKNNISHRAIAVKKLAQFFE